MTSSLITQKDPGEGNLLIRTIRYTIITAGISILSLLLLFTGIYLYFSSGLPKISSLRDYKPPTVTCVYSDDGRKIGEFYKERRIVTPLEEIPKTLINAFIAAEDSRFYMHKGIDFYSIIRAFTRNLKAGSIVQGGSTITQQVTKSFFLSPERRYSRKIKEAILAYRLDKTFTKDEILYLYLNQIYLGHGAYGVEAAAENYFGKSSKELNLSECAILAGLPQAPSRYSPFKNPELAKQRQIYVLNRMVADGFITNIEATEAMNVVLDIKPRRNWYIEKVPCYTEYVRRHVEKKYGEDALYNQGLKIYTAVNIEIQKYAQEEVSQGLMDLDKRQGYRGPIEHLSAENIEPFSQKLRYDLEDDPIEIGKILKGVVIKVDNNTRESTVKMGNIMGIIPMNSMRWARKPDIHVGYWEGSITEPGLALKVGDVIMVRANGVKKKDDTNSPKEVDLLKITPDKEDIWDLSLEQTPLSEAGLLSIEAETGYVKAMIGGRDFTDSQFNRAIQSRRQPGSAFKPIVYAAALDKGYTPATMIIDSPVVYLDEERDSTWKPNNYEKKFHGPTLFREALTKSMNIITIKILKDIGIDYVIDYSKKLGIESPLARDLSIALGSSGVSLLELVTAYSVFPNMGYLVQPTFILKIEDREGNILEEAVPIKNQVIDMSTAYIMTSLLEGVIQHGTGKRVRSLNRPAAGKTGTTNSLHDAWFVGYTPRYITGVWVGNDSKSPLGKGETGSRAASPIWLGFMQKALKDKPVRVFQVPEGVVFSKIDAKTGLLPIPESEETIFECFKEGTVPTEYTPKPEVREDSVQLFKDDL
ncbi:MAG: PBP1A family penicillin-binding protein [Proteobacteria bacterium]|nr:PBP1A family penicillin-binding protein [Pseudomonadota bacterium]